uniref:RRM domain-containing protein n=1 Tax=Electrophorus electricus TaxID=8005 RepID=A0A4W4GWX8_ELEEL
MNCNTNVVQVTNVSPSTTSEQMRTLFGFLGTVEDLRLFPPDDSTMPVTSRVCFVRFKEQESVGVSQHLTNTVFVDRALIVVPYAEEGKRRAPSLKAESGPLPANRRL